VSIARALRDRGVAATLLGSAEATLRGSELASEEFMCTRDLMSRMERRVRADPTVCLVHAAAVGDYEVATDASKLPSGRPELTLHLTPTPKIADHVRSWGLKGLYVTFKAAAPETDAQALLALARRQRDRTGCDLVFANVLGRLHADIALVGEQIQWFEARHDAQQALIDVIASHAVP